MQQYYLIPNHIKKENPYVVYAQFIKLITDMLCGFFPYFI